MPGKDGDYPLTNIYVTCSLAHFGGLGGIYIGFHSLQCYIKALADYSHIFGGAENLQHGGTSLQISKHVARNMTHIIQF